MPVISELQSILVGPDVTRAFAYVDPPDPAMGTNSTGQATTCDYQWYTCDDPDFVAVSGPSAFFSWSSTSWPRMDQMTFALVKSDYIGGDERGHGTVYGIFKTLHAHVRAVRDGSCGS